jgi:pimeloyl-ACP methyl ester carboxylesterase
MTSHEDDADTAARQRYESLYQAALPLYQEQRFAEALARVEEAGTDFGPWSSDITHVRACLQALVGRPEEALATLQAGLADGQWWRQDLLRDDDDLATLTELDGFDELVREAQARADAYNATALRSAPIVNRPDGAAKGLLVALHGGDGRAERVAAMFSSATERGFLVVAPWSSSHITPVRASWGWSARGGTSADVSHALAVLTDPERELPVVVAGFSAGGRAALRWALHADPVPVSGVILVSPAIESDLLPQNLPDDLRGLVLLGALDPWAERVRETVKRLEPIGVRLDVIDDLGHQEPPDFAQRLVAELDRLDSPIR